MILYYGVALMIGLVISMIYWLGESLVHVLIFHSGTFISQVFSHDINEIWMRSVISFLFMIILLTVAAVLKKELLLSERIKVAYQVLSVMREGCVITNSKQEIIYVNQRYEAISGYSMKEVLGKSPSTLSSGKQSASFYKVMWSNIEKNGFWEGEIWNRTKSGELYPQWTTISVIRNKQGNPQFYVGVFNDITLNKQREAKLLEYGYYDPLTNLPNRRFFIEKLEQAIKEAERNHQQLAVLFIDLDHFKPINDQYGHLVGDQFLCEAGISIKKLIRQSDVLSRFGGDEFVVLFINIQSRESAIQLANKLLSSLNELQIIIESHTLQVSASIGGAVYPDDTLNGEVLIGLADTAMYKVKNSSRNGVVFTEIRQ